MIKLNNTKDAEAFLRTMFGADGERLPHITQIEYKEEPGVYWVDAFWDNGMLFCVWVPGFGISLLTVDTCGKQYYISGYNGAVLNRFERIVAHKIEKQYPWQGGRHYLHKLSPYKGKLYRTATVLNIIAGVSIFSLLVYAAYGKWHVYGTYNLFSFVVSAVFHGSVALIVGFVVQNILRRLFKD